MEIWRLLDLSCADAESNLALEEAVARAVATGRAPSTLRFWAEDNAVILGRFQDPQLEVNLAACSRYRTAVVRRFTGGGAVYHDSGNLNWAVSLAREHPLVRSAGINVPRIYNVLSAGVVQGLRRLGAAARFVPPSDIRIHDRKVSGTAGAVKWGGVFFHGTLLVSSDLRRIEEILDAPEAPASATRTVRSVKKPMITLGEALGRDVGMSEVKSQLVRGFEEALGVRLEAGALTGEEVRSFSVLPGSDLCGVDPEAAGSISQRTTEKPRVAGSS
jgi:lipoate---protein ligase